MSPTITRRLGQGSSFGVSLVGIAYLVALVIGFTTHGLTAPILDPLLAVMESLTLLSAPLLLVMCAALYGRAPEGRKTVGAIALAFMTLTTGITSGVHFVELTAVRQLGAARLVWPSPVYALELLAWDGFLGLALIFAGFTLENKGQEQRVRCSLLVCGILCLFGIFGPLFGNMRLQIVGIFGYGAVLPFTSLLLSKLFRQDLYKC